VKPSTRGRAATVVISALGLFGFALLTFSIVGLLGLVSTPVGPIRQHLSPSDLASSAVAGATLMLAAFTAFLALVTRASVAATTREADIATQALAAAQETARVGAEQVKATNRHAEIAQETLEASWRPVLVDVPGAQVAVFSHDGGGLDVTVKLRNIGSGPAIISRAGLSAGSAGVLASRIRSSVVGPDEMTTIDFALPPEPPEARAIMANLKADAAVAVTVFYGDQGGHHRWRTRAEVDKPGPDSGWWIRDVELSEENAEPFAKSGPMFSAPPE
jgi:hypothetical protein